MDGCTLFSQIFQTLSEQEVVQDKSIPSLDLKVEAKEDTTESLYLCVPIQGINKEGSLFIHRMFCDNQGKTYYMCY